MLLTELPPKGADNEQRDPMATESAYPVRFRSHTGTLPVSTATVG